MSTFEAATLVLILVGLIIPFWTMTALVVLGDRESKKNPTKIRSAKYASLMKEFSEVLSEDSYKFNAPVLIACLRDLKSFPEYRDASILFLDSINVTGKNKFDDMARTEIKAVDAYLLSLKDD